MVAAAKLRKAQEAAEAARPYAERMEAVLDNLSSALQGRDGSPQLLVGNGRDDVHLLLVATAERGLCGGFNSSISRLCPRSCPKPDGAGQDGQDLVRRQEGAMMP